MLESVDNDDRLSRTVEACVNESVNVVGMPHLIRVVALSGTASDLAREQAVRRADDVGWNCLRANLDEWRCGRSCICQLARRWRQANHRDCHYHNCQSR